LHSIRWEEFFPITSKEESLVALRQVIPLLWISASLQIKFL